MWNVALLAEGVDRNLMNGDVFAAVQVALLAEGVDRNARSPIPAILPVNVALLAEGVDRNLFPLSIRAMEFWSPSSRRAWIEIFCPPERSLG